MRSCWIALVVMLVSTPALARFRVKAPRPGYSDFRQAVRASKAVEAKVPLRLEASSRPRVVTKVRDGIIHEKATVVANVPFKDFMRRMDPADWSRNLPQRWGGQIVRLKDRQGPRGRTVLQQERMVLGIPALDMTKNTVVKVGQDRATVRWQVTHSDRSLPTLGHRTVLMDNGWIEFARTQDNKVRITTRSAHKVSTVPSAVLSKIAPRLTEKVLAASLRSYFKQTVKRYKAIAEGTRRAR